MKKGWRLETLGGLCDILDTLRKPITRCDRTSGEFPYYGATGIVDFVNDFIFDEPLVLVGEDGAKWASGEATAFRVEGKYWVNNHAHVLRPHRGTVLDNWLVYFLTHSDLSEFVSGLTVPKLNQANLREIPIPVPPLPEQQRIVRILDEAFAAIAVAKANTEKNLQDARALFESHLSAVFTQKGEGWVEKRLGEIAANISTGPFGTMLHKSDYVLDGIPVVNPMNIVGSRIVPSSRMMVNGETKERLKAYVLEVGDVVIGRRGELGRCALVREQEAGWLCGTGSFRVRLTPVMEGQFFVPLFGSEQMKARLNASSVGATMGNLNQGIINELLLPVPPIAEQAEIIGNLTELESGIDELESIYWRKIAALEELKKSLLHQAFSGALA